MVEEESLTDNVSDSLMKVRTTAVVNIQETSVSASNHPVATDADLDNRLDWETVRDGYLQPEGSLGDDLP